jgi:hypothetical protein
MERKDPSGLSSGDGMWHGDVKMTPSWSASGVSDVKDEGCCTGKDGKQGVLQSVTYSGASWWLSGITMQDPDYSGMDQSEKDDPGDLMSSLIEHEKSHIRITNKWLSKLKGKKHYLGTKKFTICNTGDLQKAISEGLAPFVIPLMWDLLLPWERENNRLDRAFGTDLSFPEAGT